MLITEASVRFYALPYTREVVWANAVEREGVFALVRLVDEDGHVGIAEATVKATWGGVSVRSLAAALEDIFFPAIVDVEFANHAAVLARCDGVPENRLAKGLVDNALWAMGSAAAGRPLWQRWGGAQRVDVTWAVTRQAPLLMAEEAATMCSLHGFRTLKVKGGQGRAVDVAALREIRAAVGDGVRLTMDANSAYKADEALTWNRAIADAGAIVSEDPCALVADEGFKALRDASPIPLLVDRACTSEAEAAAFLRVGAQGLSVKPARVGLSIARRIAERAAEAGARVAVGIHAESALGTLQSLQLAAVLPEDLTLTAAEQTFFLMMDDQVIPPPVIREGAMTLPPIADLGTLVDWDRVERYAVRP